MALIDRLNDLVEDTRYALVKLGKQEANKSWGYDYCETELDLEIKELAKAVEILRNQALESGICICEDELKSIQNRVRKVLGPECKTNPLSFSADKSGLAQWTLEHPDCVAYETMSDYLHAQCKKVGIDIKAYIKKCADVDINVKVAERKLCEIASLSLEVEKIVCDVDVKLEVDEKKCELEFNTLVKPLDCGVDFNVYLRARKCGLDLKTISRLIKCGATIKPTLTSVDVCFPEVPGNICSVTVNCPTELDCSLFDDCDCGLEDCEFLGTYFPSLGIVGCEGCSIDVPPVLTGGSSFWEITDFGEDFIEYTFTNQKECCTPEEQTSYDCFFDEISSQIDNSPCWLACDAANNGCYIACEDDPECQLECDAVYNNCIQICYDTLVAPLTEARVSCCDFEYTATLLVTTSIESEPCGDTAVVLYRWPAIFTDTFGTNKECVVLNYTINC